MIYYLLFPLKAYFTPLNMLGYISFRASSAAITAILIAFIFGKPIIAFLQRLSFSEVIRSDGPASHLKKAGTPTMGGLLIHLCVLIPTFLWADLSNRLVHMVLLATIWMGLIGFWDDYHKIKRRDKNGISPRVKLLAQSSLGIVIGSLIYFYPINAELSGATIVPFFKGFSINLGIFYILFAMLVINGTSNAVNLTDGLDGLATGLMSIVALALAAIAYISGRIDFSAYLNIPYIPGAGELTIFLAAMFGGLLGFLWYNAKPAEVFMGDVGSLAYGAAIGTSAVLLKQELLLFIIGGVFVMETISVMLQISWFKCTKRRLGAGRRIFKMAPIHHHFELKGWEESKVVVRFWILGILFALMALATFKIR